MKRGSILLALVFFVASSQGQWTATKDRTSGRVVFLRNIRVITEPPAEESAPVRSARYMSLAAKANVKFDPVTVADSFLAANAKSFGIRLPAKYLSPKSVAIDELGISHVRYEQRYSDIPLDGAEVIVHISADGKASSASVSAISSLMPNSIKAKITRAKAAAIATEIWKGQFPGLGAPDLVEPELKLYSQALVQNAKGSRDLNLGGSGAIV